MILGKKLNITSEKLEECLQDKESHEKIKRIHERNHIIKKKKKRLYPVCKLILLMLYTV